MALKLGKKPATTDSRDLLFKNLVDATTLPSIPSIFGYAGSYQDWKMLGNGPDDTVVPGFQGAGDCVFAGAAHETMLWNKLAGHSVRFLGANVISDYSSVTGYVIGDDSTDNGTDVRVGLKYRQSIGIVDSKAQRHKIGAYVRLDPKNWDQLLEAAYIFNAVGIGFEFPASAMDQFDARQKWSYVAGSQIEGGHYVPVMGRPSKNEGSCVTWGRRQVFTKEFYEEYNDETWAFISEESLKDGKNIRGFDLTQLKADLAALKNIT